MSIQQHMAARQMVQFQAVGEFLYVAECPGAVRVRTVRGEYRLSQGAQILDPELSGLVTIENLGEPGLVEIIVGMGRYVPPTDGQQVAVTTMPALVLAAGQELGISALPPVTVEALPAVALKTGQKIDVTASQTLPVQPQTGTTLSGQASALPLTIAANSDRQSLWLKAPASNTGAVAINGFELDPGERIELRVGCAVTVTGSATDGVQYLEY